MKKMNKKGFTIVELVIVIAVIAILAGVLIPTFSGVVEKANASAAQQQAASAEKIALSMSSNATLPDETAFVIYEKNVSKYYYEYKNNKLTDDEKNDAKSMAKTGYDTKLGSIIVSNEYFLNGEETISPVASSEAATTEVSNLVAKLADMSGIANTTFAAVSEEQTAYYTLERNTAKTGYILHVLIATTGFPNVGKTLATAAGTNILAETYEVEVFTSVDLTDDCVIFVPTYTKSN